MVKIFTFHNVSINSNRPSRTCQRLRKFTFHNVSINSQIGIRDFYHAHAFTFHNVSINSSTHSDNLNAFRHLHSIMYLLILFSVLPILSLPGNLHSIMYLLIRISGRSASLCNFIYIP